MRLLYLLSTATFSCFLADLSK